MVKTLFHLFSLSLILLENAELVYVALFHL